MRIAWEYALIGAVGPPPMVCRNCQSYQSAPALYRCHRVTTPFAQNANHCAFPVNRGTHVPTVICEPSCATARIELSRHSKPNPVRSSGPEIVSVPVPTRTRTIPEDWLPK